MSNAKFAVLGNDLILTTYNGIFILPNGTSTWSKLNTSPLPSGLAYAIAVSGNKLYVGIGGNYILVSSDHGVTWHDFSYGYGGGFPNNLVAIGTDLYCGSFNAGVWKRSMLDTLTGIREPFSTNDYRLQLFNIPNPFHSSSIVSYYLPKTGPVDIRLFSLEGKEIETLVAEKQEEGKHELNIDGFHLNPGMYVLEMIASGKTAFVKIVKQ